MANNTQLPGTGTGTADIIVATEKITGVDYQKIKIIDATAASETPTGVAANPFVIAGTVDLGATDNAVLDTMVTALQLIDNMISGSEAQVDVITLPAVTIAAAQTLATVTTVGTVTTVSTVTSVSSCTLAAETTKVIGTVRVASGGIASGGIASGAIASGAIAAGAVAAGAVVSGAILSGAFASGSIAAGAVAAGATSFVKLEDVASADGEAGVCVFAIRDDTCDIRSATEGDFEYFHVDAVGRLWVNPQGNVAHDAGDSGNPVKIGTKCESTPSAQVVADADRQDVLSDMDGAIFVREGCTLGDCLTESISNTNGTATACAVFTTGAGIRNIITDIVAYNSSATAGFALITDGSGGTTLMCVPLPAGGGAVINLQTPIKTTANTALYYDVSGALTTVYLTFVGYRSKVT